MIRTRIIPGLVAAFVVAVPLRAQLSLDPTSPRYQEIARLAQEGYGDSARASIARLMSRLQANDPGYAEALYTSGFVARTGDSMRNVFARLVVEHQSSPWAGKALVRLAQIEFGLNNMDKVVDDITRLFNDFSDSPALPTGALWGARAAFSQQKAQLACGWLTKGIAAAGDDLELKNQLQFSRQGCSAGNGVQYTPVTPDSLRQGPPRTADTVAHPPVTAPPPPPPPPAPAPAGKPPAGKPAAGAAASPWRVQVAAVSDKAVIKRLVQKLEAAGFRTYTPPGPRGLTKVQAGPFATRAAAVAAVARIKAAAGGSPIVVPAP